jgi:hypothetical protein
MQQHNGEFQIDRSDYNLITSLARQTFKGTAYTDRQHDLAKQKIELYKDQFVNNGYNIDIAVDTLRFPLRKIDRSRWIKIVDYPENTVYESYKTHHWIAIRFIFNKKLISLIETIKSGDNDAIYDKENKIHYFTLTEQNIYNVINELKDKNFDIDPLLKEKYNEIVDIKNNKDQYIPGVYNFKLKNLTDRSLNYIISDIGEPSRDNLSLFKDRQHLYGLVHFDEDPLNESIQQLSVLTQKIVKRKSTQVLINSQEYNFTNVVDSLLELNRDPILIVLNSQTDYDDLVVTHNELKNVYQTFSVLYRKDNTAPEDKEFNQYISKNGLNNSIDNYPEIVYINNNKFPKTLLKTDWRPKTVIFVEASPLIRNKLDYYVNECDLVVHFGGNVHSYMRYELNGIDKI